MVSGAVKQQLYHGATVRKTNQYNIDTSAQRSHHTLKPMQKGKPNDVHFYWYFTLWATAITQMQRHNCPVQGITFSVFGMTGKLNFKHSTKNIYSQAILCLDHMYEYLYNNI